MSKRAPYPSRPSRNLPPPGSSRPAELPTIVPSSGASEPRTWLPRLLVESMLIVFSVLLALVVDDWRDGRRDRERAVQALESFTREIRNNKKTLETLQPYHVYLKGQISAIPRERRGNLMDAASEIEGWQGLRPAVLYDAAWRTALATGALDRLDFKIVSDLSWIYTLQDRLDDFSVAQVTSRPQDLSDPNAPQFFAGALGDIAAMEQELLAVYDQYLRTVEAGR